MSKRLMLAIRLAPLLGALVLAIPAQAAPQGGGAEHRSFERGGRGDSRGGDFRGGEFREHRHDFGDRFGFGFGWGGWWGWDPYWYPYAYYYPYDYPPDPAYYAPPPASAPQASGPPPQQFWYYCDNPQGYYPYVANCGSAWRQVAPTPLSGNTITPK